MEMCQFLGQENVHCAFCPTPIVGIGMANMFVFLVVFKQMLFLLF